MLKEKGWKFKLNPMCSMVFKKIILWSGGEREGKIFTPAHTWNLYCLVEFKNWFVKADALNMF